MMQPSLLDWTPPRSIMGDRDGETYVRSRDLKRLNAQAQDVWDFMIDGKWHGLREISEVTGHPEASVSARLRDFRKPCFGGHEVQRRCISKGFFQYMLRAA